MQSELSLRIKPELDELYKSVNLSIEILMFIILVLFYTLSITII